MADLPEPELKNIDTKKISGGLFAVSVFNGVALENEVTREHEKLKKMLKKDELVGGEDWILARYNDPFTNPFVRRNEILIPIEGGFNLW